MIKFRGADLAWSVALLLGISLLGCSESQPPAAASSSSDPVDRIETDPPDFDTQILEITRDYFSLRPETASYFGVPDELAGEGVSTRLADYSVNGEAERRAGLAAIIRKLEAIDQTGLTRSQLISLEMITTETRFALGPAEVVDYGFVLGDYGIWFNPYVVSHLTGPHVEIPDILDDKMAVSNEQEAEAYLSRLNLYATALDQATARMASDQELGVVPPDFSIDRAIANLTGGIAMPAEENPFVSGFRLKLEDAGIDAGEYESRATDLVANDIYPATERLIQALTSAREVASHEAGVSRLPNGEAFYRAMITQMTDTDLAPDEIHALGLSEVDRIHAEMDRLLQQVGYTDGTVGERMSVLLNDPQFIYPNTPEGKAQLVADMKADLALADALLPEWFGKLPDQEVEIKVVPAHRATSTSGAYYHAPSMDGTRPGTYWIVLADTSTLPSYSLQTLTYHEANPGHHLQTILGLNDSQPILTSVFYSNASGEGWGLYAELLASEMGLYEGDPIDDLGRLQAELHRAVRLVVDTGMHAMGWSREKAIDYSVATEGIHVDEATSEIERYAVWPGQALGYKLGMLKILELRKRAQKQLGERFDIRTFHDSILEDGALPLNMMETKIDAWIAEQNVKPHIKKGTVD